MNFAEAIKAAVFVYVVFPFAVLVMMAFTGQPWETSIVPIMTIYYLLTFLAGFIAIFSRIARIADKL